MPNQDSARPEDSDKQAHWQEHLKAYFSGPNDPNYCLLVLKPYRIELVSMTGQDPEVWTAS